MKLNKATLGGSLDRPDASVRFYLFHGQDESASRALAERLLRGLGAEKAALPGSALRADPGLLSDEARAIGLFGGARAIWIDPAGDEVTTAVESLLSLPAVESPSIAVGGLLGRTSSLLKIAESNPAAIAHASYRPEGRDADRLVIDLGKAEGLRVAGDVASRIASAAGNDQGVIASELCKYALFLAASPQTPRELDHSTIDKLGTDSGDGDWLRISDLALDGQVEKLADQLQRLPPSESVIVPIVRALQRRIVMLAPMRARIEAGERVDAVMASSGKALFWKEKPLVARLLSGWSAARLAQLGERMSRLERSLMLSTAPVEAALGEELLAIARAAKR